jgi:hypothetical protein
MPDVTHSAEGDQGDMDHGDRGHVSPLQGTNMYEYPAVLNPKLSNQEWKTGQIPETAAEMRSFKEKQDRAEGNPPFNKKGR